MRAAIRLTLSALLCLLVSSCASLQSKHYVGEKEKAETGDISADSVWQMGEGVFHVHVTDEGRLIAASVEWNEKAKRHELRTCEVVISSLDDHRFLNVLEDGQYTILRMGMASDPSPTLVVYTVDGDKLRKDIAAGKLKATEKKDKEKGQTYNSIYVFEGPKEELDAYVKANLDMLFELDMVGVVRLISGKLE